MTPEQLAVMEQVLADLNKHYPYEDESGIIKLSLGRFMNARENLRTVIEQAKRQQALDKMAENERELGIQMQPEPVDFFDWYDNAIWGNEDFKTGCQRAWNAALEYAAPAAPVQEPVWCRHCNGSGRMVRDPDIGTDQECFVCDGAGVPAAPVQESDDLTIAYMAGYGKGKAAAQRQSARSAWVGLTDDEIDKTPCELYAPDQGGMTVEEGLQVYARAIEAKLREKNGGAA